MRQEPARDTIAAIATPAGRGGIGIVRVSGERAVACVSTLVQGAKLVLPARSSRLHALHDPATHAKLDEALLTYFPAPRSYTGEDVVEIAAHGSPVVLERVLRILLGAGARLAHPGEFTERAFLSGRLDLTQAEAVRDLIDAQTLVGAQVAAQQLGGAVARAVAPVKEELVALIALLEAGIDFAEDDTPVAPEQTVLARLDACAAPLHTLERTFAHGRLLTEGATVALVGRPNVGKSSLFNRLLARERAIVTAEPGTTRDTVQERVSIDGIPLELIDTAGLREAASEAERIGIARSREALADAMLVVAVLDATRPLGDEERALLEAARERPLLIALNKCDLRGADAALSQQVHASAPNAPVVRTSAATGEGLDALRMAALSLLTGEGRVAPEAAMLTNLRQHTAVAAALHALAQARLAVLAGVPHEMLLLDLYAALGELDSLTGATTADDILNLIFASFCIGK